MNALQAIRQFSKKKVLVIGDVMLDEYIEGNADRISPEAPIPVLLQKSVRHVLGGAGNVAANVASLGARVTLLAVVGNDTRARTLRELCARANIAPRFLVDERRPTTTKIRFVSGHHQLVRIDMESTAAIKGGVEKSCIAAIQKCPAMDAVIISDYAKGVITPKVMAALKKKFDATKLIADMKPRNADLYRGIRAITPNVKEAMEMTGIEGVADADATRMTKLLAEKLGTSIVLTRSERGVTVLEKGKSAVHLHAPAQSVRDVTGAGDTLIATLSLCLACDLSLLEAAKVANRAAGLSVGHAGTVALPKKMLLAELNA